MGGFERSGRNKLMDKMVPASMHNPDVRMTLLTPDPKSMGFTGGICSNCGSSNMIRAGHCECCTNCGTTTGCS